MPQIVMEKPARKLKLKPRRRTVAAVAAVIVVIVVGAAVYFGFFWSPFSKADIDKAAKVSEGDVEVYTGAEADKYIRMSEKFKQTSDSQKMARMRAFLILKQPSKAKTELEALQTKTKTAMRDSYYYLLGYIVEQEGDKKLAVDMYKKARQIYLEDHKTAASSEGDDASLLADYNARIVNLGGSL